MNILLLTISENAFSKAVTILWQGMLAIFIAVIVIIGFTKIMNVLDNNRKAKVDKENEDEI